MTCLKVPKNNESGISAIREALTDVLIALDESGFKPGDSADPLTVAVLKAGQALATPVRNCDMGTAEEQEQRFRKFCHRYHGGICLGCKVPATTNCECALAWAQMPYEKEENANESKP